MLADVNVKQIVITTVIVVLTVAVMYAVLIVALSYVQGQYLRKNMIGSTMVGAEVLRAKDPPAPQVRRPAVDSVSVFAEPTDEEVEPNTPSHLPQKIDPDTETLDDGTRGREVNPSRTQPDSK